MRKKPFIIGVISLTISYTFYLNMAWAQQVLFTPRDNIIFTTLNQLQEREDAFENAFKEAMKQSELVLLEAEVIEKKKKPNLSAASSGGFGLGGLSNRTHPYLTLETSYDGNVDSTHDARKSSLANTTTLGAKMNLTRRITTLNLDLFLRNKNYNNRRRNNSQEAQISALANFRFGRFLVSIFDEYFNNYISAKQIGVDDDNIQNYWKNTFTSNLGRYFNRTGFDLKYKRTDYRYEPISKSSNKIEEVWTYNQFLRLATKTRALFEYERGRTAYTLTPDPDDLHSNNFNLSVTSVLASKLSYLLKAGYKFADYKNTDNYRETTLTGSMGYTISNRSDLALNYKRVIHEEATKSDYYIENDFKLSGNHRLSANPKFKLSFSSGLDYYRYPKREVYPNPKKNKTYTYGLGLTYAFRQWLDFSLNWTLKKFKSNVDDDYLKNTVTLKAEARF